MRAFERPGLRLYIADCCHSLVAEPAAGLDVGGQHVDNGSLQLPSSKRTAASGALIGAKAS